VFEIELHAEVEEWIETLTTDRRIILLTTFRKQRNNERNEIIRARIAAADCARRNP
jgi:hypothetical protein